jgi:hypothetical protein
VILPRQSAANTGRTENNISGRDVASSVSFGIYFAIAANVAVI